MVFPHLYALDHYITRLNVPILQYSKTPKLQHSNAPVQYHSAEQYRSVAHKSGWYVEVCYELFKQIHQKQADGWNVCDNQKGNQHNR